MTDLVKIDDEVISCEDFIKLLKFSGTFDGLLEDIVKDKLTVHAVERLDEVLRLALEGDVPSRPRQGKARSAGESGAERQLEH